MRETGGLLRVTLARPLPVYILYATAVTDDDDVPFFYSDLYGHDAALARALRLPVAPVRGIMPPPELTPSGHRPRTSIPLRRDHAVSGIA